MKNKTTTLLLPLLCAILMACAGLFVACGNDDSSKGDGGTFVPDEPATYTLTFVTDGGTVIPSITEKEGSAITPPADPEKTGFEFDGWYLTPEHSGNAVTLPTKMPSENKTYYAKFLNKYVLEYNANAPAGTIVNGSTASTECVKDKPAVIAQNGFSITGYRFMGWSTSADGDVNVSAEFTLTQNTTVYAVWNKGYQNKTKQDDYLFVNGTEAVLLRNGTECKGTYDSATKTFSVTVGNETIEGRLFEDQTYSCYGENSFGIYLLYNAYTGEAVASAETLALFDNGIAKYNETVAGSYTYLSDGNFMFASANDSTEFIFKIATLEDETLAFYKQGSEEGVYTLYGGTSVLTLDGYGKATVANSEYTYTPETNGTYSLGATKIIKLYGDENYVEYNETLNGTFTDGTSTLELDGYVNATLNGKSGTFSISVKRGYESELYIRVVTESDDKTFKIDGTAIIETTAEKGKYEQFAYGSLSIDGAYYEMTLDGEGNADIIKTHTTTTAAKGTYAKVSDSTLWEFTPNSSYASYGSFKFRFFVHSNGRTMFEKYDEPYVGEFTNGSDIITLDGFGHNAAYLKSGVSSEFDSYTLSGNVLTLNGAKFALNASNKTFRPEGAESSISYYYSTKNKGTEKEPKENDLRIKLDGLSSATVWKATFNLDSYENEWKEYGKGTYSVSETSPNLWKYTKVSGYQTDFTFALFGNNFALEDAAAVKTYNNADGTTLAFDSFALPIYTDSESVAHTGVPVSYENSVGGILNNLIKFTDVDGNIFAFKLDNSDASNLTFTVIGNEFGKYEHGNKTSGVSLLLNLNGEGNASYGSYTGTYARVQSSDELWKFTETRAADSTSEREDVIFTFKLIGDKYYMEDAANFENAEYTHDNAILKLDAFGFAEYTDSQNSVTKGTYTKSEGGYVTLTAENCDVFLFRCFESQFVIPGTEKGSYTLSGGSSALELDGEGKAIFNDGESVNGDYEYSAATDDYSFTSETVSFRFKFTDNNKYVVAYKYAYRYVGTNDFNVLILGEYGDGTFINQMGVQEDGVYTVMSEHIVKLNGNYYRINFETKTFICETKGFVTDDNLLIAYLGNEKNLVLPNGITVIVNNVFAHLQSTLETIDLNGLTEISDDMFKNFSVLREVRGLNIETVGRTAFSGCSQLTTVTLGDKLTSIDYDAFARHVVCSITVLLRGALWLTALK